MPTTQAGALTSALIGMLLSRRRGVRPHRLTSTTSTDWPPVDTDAAEMPAALAAAEPGPQISCRGHGRGGVTCMHARLVHAVAGARKEAAPSLHEYDISAVGTRGA